MEELQASELGTQEYWDERYKEELANFEDHGDPGDVWFGEGTVARIVKWMTKANAIAKNSKILDVGCGNGLFLIELASEGFGNLFGVDYSEAAIALAESIAAQHKFEIKFSAGDVLDGLEGRFDVIHDKGTYDAVSLNANAGECRTKYAENVRRGLNRDALFIITSCNWTKEELDEHFKSHFEYFDHVPSPQLKFGGVTGGTVTTLIYKAKS